MFCSWLHIITYRLYNGRMLSLDTVILQLCLIFVVVRQDQDLVASAARSTCATATVITAAPAPAPMEPQTVGMWNIIGAAVLFAGPHVWISFGGIVTRKIFNIQLDTGQQSLITANRNFVVKLWLTFFLVKKIQQSSKNLDIYITATITSKQSKHSTTIFKYVCS